MTYNEFLLIFCASELLLLPVFWLILAPVGLGPLSIFKFKDYGRSYSDIGVGGLFAASCCYTLVSFTIGIVFKIALILLMH